VSNYASNTVQQIVNDNGVWTTQAKIGVGGESKLCHFPHHWFWTGRSGVANKAPSYGLKSVQQIVKNNSGDWTAQTAIDVGKKPVGLTTGLDGSIWVGRIMGSNTVQQIVKRQWCLDGADSY